MNHLSFREYLTSKTQLKSALQESPFKISKYRITKYCKLEIAESAEPLSLKPSNELIIEWVYDDINTPTAECVILMTKDSNSRISVNRDSTKFAKWLNTNCIIED